MTLYRRTLLRFKKIFRILIILCGFIFVFILTGCDPSLYGLANGGSESVYLSKPVYRDTSVNANYLSGKIYHTISNRVDHEDEKLMFGELNIHRSHSRKFYNFTYSLYGYGGFYKVKRIQKYEGNQYFMGIGQTTEFNLNLPSEHLDFRILGIRSTVLYENGSYADFRKNADDENLIENIHPNNFSVNISLTSEFVFKTKKLNFGYFNAVGITYGQQNYLTTAMGLQLTYKRFTNFVQLNISNLGLVNLSVGLNYKIE